jgi:hypothetical protein
VKPTDRDNDDDLPGHSQPRRAEHECEDVYKTRGGSSILIGSSDITRCASIETCARHSASEEHGNTLADGAPVSDRVSYCGTVTFGAWLVAYKVYLRPMRSSVKTQMSVENM